MRRSRVAERVVVAVGKRRHAFALERVGDVVEVDARRRRDPAITCRALVDVLGHGVGAQVARRRRAARRSTPARACSRCRGRSARRRRAWGSTRGSWSTSTPTAAAAAARPSPRARPTAARRSARGTAGTRAWRWRPRPCPAAAWPSGRRRSVSVSTRLTKNDATDAIVDEVAAGRGEPLEARRGTPRSPRRGGRARRSA